MSKNPRLRQTPGASEIHSGRHPEVSDTTANSMGGGLECHVLVVDDNIDAADSLGMLMKYLGLEVQTAHDGATALAIANRFRPRVILLDLGLPDISGYEVARQLRSQETSTELCLIALTGSDEVECRSKESGFDRHLVKPVDFPVLQELLFSLSDLPLKPLPSRR